MIKIIVASFGGYYFEILKSFSKTFKNDLLKYFSASVDQERRACNLKWFEHRWNILWYGRPSLSVLFVLFVLGKHLSICLHLYLGIAQIAITPPPPPHSNGHPRALFFRRDFTILPFLRLFLPFFYHFLWISAPNHPGKGLDPLKIKQMPILTWKILL